MSRRADLDGVRGFACLSVLTLHIVIGPITFQSGTIYDAIRVALCCWSSRFGRARNRCKNPIHVLLSCTCFSGLAQRLMDQAAAHHKLQKKLGDPISTRRPGNRSPKLRRTPSLSQNRPISLIDFLGWHVLLTSGTHRCGSMSFRLSFPDYRRYWAATPKSKPISLKPQCTGRPAIFFLENFV